MLRFWRKSTEELSQISGNLLIRRASERDAKGIIDCMQSVMDERIYLVSEYYLLTEKGEQNRIRNPDDLTLVCESAGRIIGVLTLQRSFHSKSRHTANLGIAIRSGYRHMGIGTAMIKRAILWSKEREIKKINLEVFSSNTNAINLYRKLGFIEEGRRRRQFVINGKYVDDVLMTYYTDEL